MLRLVCNRTTNCHSFRYYRKPTERETAKKVTPSMIVARFGGAIRLNERKVSNALKELGYQQVWMHHGRVWLVMERTQDEINRILPEPATDATDDSTTFT